MTSLATTPDLHSNKDALLSISTFLSLKQLSSLRGICKQFNSWLSDLSSFSWKKRIELAFPNNHQSVLKQSVEDQIAKLQIFDTLVDNGYQVSFFSLSSLLDVASVEVNSKLQVPWACQLFVITYNKTSALVFDSISGKPSSRLDLQEMKSINSVFLDSKNKKVGFVNYETGVMKMYLLDDNSELKYEADFTCDALKSHQKPIKQIYGDYIVAKKDYSTLAWYSLSSNKEVKEVKLPESDGVYLTASVVDPVIYVSETSDDMFLIHEIDCTLADDEPMYEIFSDSLNIEMDNCGDGVDGIKLIETEHGSVLNIYLLGTGDRGFKALDLSSEEIVLSLHYDQFSGLDTIQHNPGTKFYSLRRDSYKRSAIAIRESGKSHADNNAQDDEKVKSDDEDEPEEEDQDEEEEEDYDPTKGAYFTLKSDGQQNGTWLNKDIFAVKTGGTKSKQPRQVFFSIAKRDVIGWIDDDIDEVFMSGNKIVAFTQSGDLYRVTLEEEEEVEDDQDEEKNVDTEDVPEKKDDTSGVNDKKRKASEMEDDESEAQQSPKKKMKV